MTDDTKLPPLPYPQIPGNDYAPRDMWDYARAAIKYDRQQRGEPVGELEPTFPAGNSNMLGGVYKLGFFSGQGIPVYTTPQPTTPALEPSDEDIERLAAEHLSAHARFVGAGEVNYEGEVEFARALLARYGQTTTPKGWRLVPVVPTSKQICHMAMRISGADEDGWYRTNKSDWSKCVEKAEQTYQQALENAPKFGEED